MATTGGQAFASAVSGAFTGAINAVVTDTKLSRGILRGAATGAAIGAIVHAIKGSPEQRVVRVDKGNQQNRQILLAANADSIEELDAILGEGWELVTDAAGEQGGRVSVTTSVNPETGEHFYKIRGAICAASAQSCNNTLADQVFGDVNGNDIPFTDNDLGSGPRNLLPYLPRPLGNQPIDHIENISLRTSINRTLPGHNFHRGDVTHHVHFEAGMLYYDVIGTGTGSNPGFNNWIGIRLFEPGVQDVVNQYGR